MSASRAFPWTEEQLSQHLTKAVAAYWKGRGGQSKKQVKIGGKDIGTRSEVTGGQHLNGILKLLCEVIRATGFAEHEILLNIGMELPGYYRPQKKWDVVVIRDGRLYAAVELKSQAGSFGNNFNNRSEEAIGNSTDFWTAYREGLLGIQEPWLGYFFLLEQGPKSTKPVKLKKGCFPPMAVFEGTSYAERYAILCERLKLERKYSRVALLLTPRGKTGEHHEPNPELNFHGFLSSLFRHLNNR